MSKPQSTTTQDAAENEPVAASLPAGGAVVQSTARPVTRAAPSDVRDGLVEAGLEPLQVSRSPWRFFTYKTSFVALVLIPSILVIAYLIFASDQYVAETRFAVRTAQFEVGRDLTKSSGVTATQNSPLQMPTVTGPEAYIVATYVRSAAIIADLPKDINVRTIFSRPEADFWARLPRDASAEDLASYWRKMVTTHVDSLSGVVTVNVLAFRPQDATDLAKAIIDASERLVNSLSLRARNDAMGRAEEEVKRAEGLVQEASREMRIYRDQQGFLDPGSQASSTSTLLMQTMTERLRLQNEYFVALRAMSPTAPTVVALKSRLDAVDVQIDRLKGQLTGASSDQKTVSASLVRYEEIELKRLFSEKLYAMAQDALDRARQKAERQNMYLSVFVPPSLPQQALYPERLSMSLLVPLMILILWSILALVAASIRDHTH